MSRVTGSSKFGKFQKRSEVRCALRMETGLHLESVGGRTSWCFSCMSQADLSAAAAVASGCCARELLFPLLALAAKGQLQLFKSCGASVYTNPTEWCPRLGCDKTGGRMWFASAIFIDHLCSPVCSLLSPGTRVCELGAGCGSVGLALNFKLGCDVTLKRPAPCLPPRLANVSTLFWAATLPTEMLTTWRCWRA